MAAPQQVRPLVRTLVVVLILCGGRLAAQGQGTVEEPSPDERRSLGGGIGFLVAGSNVGLGPSAAVLYRLKSLPSAKTRISAVADFGVYRLAGAMTATMMAGVRVNVNTRREIMPYVQVAATVLGRGGTGTARPSIGAGVETWIKRCVKFTSEIQIIGRGDATRVFVGLAIPVRED
jgi:hypothetical protein